MRRDRTVLALVVAAALATSPAVLAQQAPSARSETREQAKSGLPRSDEKFVMDAAKGSMAEVELGKMAAEKGTSDLVKQFGQRMVDDHGKASAELKDLAQKKNLTLPAELDSKHRQVRDRLAKLRGAEFDRAYADEMVRDHKKDVGEFKREAGRAKDPDLKTWAGKTVPTLEDHLKQAQQMQAQVKSAPRAAR
jgi:putative membrane protein